MKTKQLYIISIALLSIAGCTKEYSIESHCGEEITITATIAETPRTRTIIDGTSVLWEAGDEIKIFYGESGGRFTSIATTPSTTSDFSGNLNFVFGSNEGVGGSKYLWAVYPYRSDATSDGESITTTLPSEQTGRADSFAQSTNITLAKSNSFNMGFYNVCGGLRFSLTQEGVKEVIFEGRNEESLAGKVKLAFSGKVPVVEDIVSGEKSITLTAPNGGTFETGKWYYIVALPGTLSNGFRVTFNTATQYATLLSSSSVTIKRGIFGSLADADEGLIFVDKGTDPQGDNIVFKDPAAKFACVAKFDTDGDGEISIEEAEAVTSFSGLFTDWKAVVSFNEISYFKNVHSISGLFDGCTKLEVITIPENITDLGTSAFSGCSSLTTVILPSNITALGDYTFQNCSKLVSIGIPSKVAYVGNYAFDGCSSLTQIDLPSGITSLGSNSFRNCKELHTINIPAGVKTLGQFAFSGCSVLTQIVIPEGVSSIPNYCFNDCSSLSSIDIPSGVSSIGSYAFSGVNNMWSLRLPSSITSLGNACFGSGITCVILPSTSPVSIQSDTFLEQTGIFVPSNLIEMYKVMTNWLNYSYKMHPIGFFKEKNDLLSSCVLGTSGAIDMGTSAKWAAYNVGATKPEEYGDYYAWGETESKSNYDWNSYFDSIDGSMSNFIKYFKGEGGKTVLDPEDDVAHVKWGGEWRMPTREEFKELLKSCYWEWATYEGVGGYMVYSFTGKKIFFPATGYGQGTDFNYAGGLGRYWSSSLLTSNSSIAYCLSFDDGSVYTFSYYRYFGQFVRPVSE